MFCFEGSCDNLKGQRTLKTMFIVNCRCFTRVKCFSKKVKCPAMDKQKKMTCSVVKPATQFLSPRNAHNAVKIVVRKKSIRPYFPSKTGKSASHLSAPGWISTLLLPAPSSSLPAPGLLSQSFHSNRNDRCPFPENKRRNK